jgi:pyruvate-ferredoxin/flavodoxin oxidoreductase
MREKFITVEGNEAAARMAYSVNEVIAIYPITPSSGMGELADLWASEARPNLWGSVPRVVEMQSEGGAAGAVHGALQAGSLTTTFTASQGLLLMIPNMYKIAGELTPAVFHVAARSVAAQALSIFGDHSDVMATRATGWAMLASSSVQEAMDLALIAHASTLESRIPFLHFFDGFRTSHEVAKIALVGEEVIRAMIDDELVRAHRARALSPDHPVVRGTAQNPDVFFQARESANPFYIACPAIVQRAMDRFAELTGRAYRLFDYFGAPDADRVIVIMGSGGQTCRETVEYLAGRGEKVGVVQARLFRPFSAEHLLGAIPESARVVAALDRTKEPGSLGEPLYLDVAASFSEASDSGGWKRDRLPGIFGGRFGLSSKEFTPAMIKGVFDAMANGLPSRHFTIGIRDDVTHASVDYDPTFSTENDESVRAIFFGLGADGTVGANKNSIKIIGDETDLHAQGYFVYDSKKSGSTTVSHLRFGPHPIRSSYLVHKASFVACHQSSFLEKMDVLKAAEQGATFLLNAPGPAEELWARLPRTIQKQIIDKRLRVFVIDAYAVAKSLGLGRRINTIMQACFFAISNVLPREEAIEAIKRAIRKTYGKRGEAVVEKNFAAVDEALEHLRELELPVEVSSEHDLLPAIPEEAPEFVREVTARMIEGRGDELPVSALPVDGTYPLGSARWEKRAIAMEVPVWDEGICIQCGKCVLVCPHSVIRGKLYDPSLLSEAPDGFKSTDARWRGVDGKVFTLQVSVEDCTGCRLCVEVCPVKNKQETRLKAINMEPLAPIRERESANWNFFAGLPHPDRGSLGLDKVKDVQLLEPLFEFSGACAGCGETPYVKLLSQLFGDRTLLANATGCSSIYGGNLPTTPWTVDADGRGPAWSNSLFEDNAEFGLGMRLASDAQARFARELLKAMSAEIGEDLVHGLLEADQSKDSGISEQRQRVSELKGRLSRLEHPMAVNLRAVADSLVRRSVWIMGGDGWAYDIGFGGVDHVLASSEDVNLLVLDTEVYSNTGGQMSKSTPRAAVAKFAAGGKPTPKKDLALIAMSYGNVYVARVAMGASDVQTVRAFREAESYRGASLIIAYSHCIAHGYDLAHGMEQQSLAVKSGHWPLLRFDPRREAEGKNPLQLDSKAPTIPLKQYVYNETRYTMLAQAKPQAARELLAAAQRDVEKRWACYEHLASDESIKGSSPSEDRHDD